MKDPRDERGFFMFERDQASRTASSFSSLSFLAFSRSNEKMRSTSMKTIFFVRHGLTEGNEQNVYQFPTTPLSEIGFQQAQVVAERFKTIPLDKILASDYVRAVQTASIIHHAVQVPMESSPLFQEVHRPSSIRGKTKDDPETKVIMQQLKEHFADPSWHHSDEENFYDLKRRALEAVSFLSAQSEERLLVVTHGFILRMMLAVMLFGDSLTSDMCAKMNTFFVTKNTGITMIQEDNGVFSLLTWNDHVHLGEF